VVADDAAQMADAVSASLSDALGTAELGRVGHEAVTAGHTWDVALAPLVDAVSR